MDGFKLNTKLQYFSKICGGNSRMKYHCHQATVQLQLNKLLLLLLILKSEKNNGDFIRRPMYIYDILLYFLLEGEMFRRKVCTENQNTDLRSIKAVPLQALSGPEGSRKLRFPDFVTTV